MGPSRGEAGGAVMWRIGPPGWSTLRADSGVALGWVRPDLTWVVLPVVQPTCYHPGQAGQSATLEAAKAAVEAAYWAQAAQELTS